jgi:SAM-dependent methyltransferase
MPPGRRLVLASRPWGLSSRAGGTVQPGLGSIKSPGGTQRQEMVFRPLPRATPVLPDPKVAHPSRTYDYLLGGKDNFAADRELMEQSFAVPEGRGRVRANRLFLGRAVRFLAGGAGIRQILDIGCGMPTPLQESVHEIAQQIAPETRVVYVDNNAVAVTHLKALVADEKTVAFHGDLREPDSTLNHPVTRATLDLSRPVGLLLAGVLRFLTDEEEPAQALARLRDALAPGSYVVITHISADLDPRVPEMTRLFDRAAAPMVERSRARIEQILEGFEPMEPGIVPVHEWRPDGIIRETGNAYGAVARKY